MCGIAGYKTEKSYSPEILQNMLHSIAHRGPDSFGVYNTHAYSAGMQRLAINGLEDGHQPLYNMNKNIVLLYNGEIYNSPILRKELEAKGYVFKTHSDGEVICHLYQELGNEAFEHLDGMFAIALWIESDRRLILARDLAGEKPLYYAKLSEQEVVFASELKSLKKFPALNLTLNQQALWDFPTFLWIPEPATVYNEIMAIPPGHFLTVSDRGTTLQSYSNRFSKGEFLSQDIIAETRETVTDAVHSRLLSDVKVGCFLSGGLDSSIVTTLAAQKIANLSTFSVAFEDLTDPYHGHSDESVEATHYAKHLKTDHHIIKVDSDVFRGLLDDFTKFGDQPFAVSSGLGILAVAKEARKQGIKVLLSGDGADECFGGYSWYSHLNQLSPTTSDNNNQNSIISFQNFGLNLDERLNSLAHYSPQQRAWAWHYYAHEKEKKHLFSDDFAGDISSSLRHFSEFNATDNWCAEDYITHDRQFYFPNEMLRKLDRMTMAYSIEGRVPFAAASVLALSNKLKYHHMVQGDTLKWVLRNAFKDILPSSIINRAKHGFNVPIDHWLKGKWRDLLEETFSADSALSKMGLISKNARKVAYDMLQDKRRLNGHTLFCFIMLNRWLERENDGNYC